MSRGSLKQSLLAGLAVAAVLGAALPVTAQTAPPLPVPTNLAAPPPVAPTASAAPAATLPAPAAIPTPAVTPPPLPAASVTPAAPASPAPSASPAGRRKKSKPAASPEASPSETPSPPAFASLDGDWEFVESSGEDDVYSRLILRQTGQQLLGTWKQKGKSYPVTGVYENSSGKAGIRLTATVDGKEWTMNGYVDNASDMVGIVRDPQGKQIVFTANHRAAAKQELLIKP